MDEGQLGAEAEEGEGAVEGGEAVGMGEVFSFLGSHGEVGPVGLVEGTGDGGGGAEAEAEGEGEGGGEAAPGSGGAMGTQFGFFFSIACSEAEGEGRGGLPASFEGEVPVGTVEVPGIFVASFVPGSVLKSDPMRTESLRAFEAQAVFHVMGFVAGPMLAATGEEAHFRVARDDPARAGVQGEHYAVEFLAAVFLSQEVRTGAQSPPWLQGIFVLGAPPGDETHPGGGFGFVGDPEGQSVEPDDVLGGGGVDVAVRGEGEAEMRVPTAAGADGVEVTPHVLRHGFGRFAGQYALEVGAGQFVFPLEEESAGQFETGSGEIGLENQNASQGGDGRVQQGFSGLIIEVGRACSADARQSRQEKEVDVVRFGRQERLEQLEGLEVASLVDERFGILEAGLQGSRHQQTKVEYRQQTRLEQWYLA